MERIKFLILLMAVTFNFITSTAQDINPYLLKGMEAMDNNDSAKALEFFKKGASEGDKYCYGRLAALYLYGIGVDVDLQECRKWAMRGYELGNSYSTMILGFSFLIEGGMNNMEALERGIPFFIYAYNADDRKFESDGGFSDICGMVAGYFTATGNNAEAEKWIERGIKEYPEHYPNYGAASMLYYSWENYSKALEYATIAEEGGDLRGTLIKGLCLINGEGIPIDEELGFKKIRKSAIAEVDAQAPYFLGLCYFYGQGTDTNKTEAKKWFEKAAQLGSEAAISILQEEY